MSAGMTIQVPKNKCELCVGKPWACANCSCWRIMAEREKRRAGQPVRSDSKVGVEEKR